MKKKFLLFTILLVSFLSQLQILQAQPNDAKMQWWKEARFGLFIHWGIYSVPAGTWNGKQIPGIGEWIMNRGKIPMADYQKFAAQFNPIKFNAEEWVKMAKDAGMKYIVITSKHHDGFAMFKSKADAFNIVDATPFKRDIIQELATACKKYNIKFGLYYSQAQDWNHPGGAANGGRWDSAQKGSMDTYIKNIAVPQVKEILTAYNPAIIWFDTPTDMTKERATLIADELKPYPNLIINNRLGGGYDGDLETPEQYIPATGIPGKNWESCMTMNDTWGFKSYDENWKTPEVLIRNLVDIASKGGNYLLNVGPTSEGLIPMPSVERLKEMGVWLKVNGESVYGSSASPFAYLPWGRCTQKQNKLYLHVFNWPVDGKLKLPLANDVVKAYLLSDKKTNIKTHKEGNYTYLDVPASAPDKIASVIVLDIKGDVSTSIKNPIPTMGKSAIVSSTEPDANDKWNGKNAFDNDSKTSWKGLKTDTSGWISVNLSEPLSIGAAGFSEAGGRIQKYILEYKDGNTWKPILEGKGLGNSFKQFTPVKAQEFRLNILQAKPGGIELKEFHLYYLE